MSCHMDIRLCDSNGRKKLVNAINIKHTKLAADHNITLSAPQFKYQVDKSGVMDEVPYPINEFFKKKCRDPYLITVRILKVAEYVLDRQKRF